MSTISYRSIIEGFMNPDEVRYPTLSHIYKFFIKEAESIQGGGEEYVYSKEWLGIYWPADEYMFIYLTVEKKWDQFYKEASILLRDIYVSADLDIDLHPYRNNSKYFFTTSQIQLDLTNRILIFNYDSLYSTFAGIKNNLPKDYIPKIKIKIKSTYKKPQIIKNPIKKREMDNLMKKYNYKP
jgi:hypothetical protein